MLQPLTLNEGCVRGRGLPAVALPPLLSLAEDMRTQAGAPAPPPPPPPPCTSSSCPPPPPCTSSSCPPPPPCTSPSCPPPSPALSISPSITLLSGSPHSSSSAPLHPYTSSSAPLHPPSSLLRPSVFCDSPCVPLTSCPPPLPLPPPPACCPCSSILPRLLAAHRLEVRRLLRGTLASLGRRLESLERSSRRRKRRRRRGGFAPDLPPPNFTPAVPVTSCSSSSSSSDRLEYSRGEPGVVCRRRIHRGEGRVGEEEEEEKKEEEEGGRFVGRMAVSFTRGADEEEEHLLTLHTFLQPTHMRREEGGGVQSEDTNSVAMTTNGYATPLLLLRSDSQHALHRNHLALSRWTDSQSGAFTLSPSQWCFSEQTPPVSSCSNHSTAHMWLSSGWSFSPAPMLGLSAAAVGAVLDAVRGGAYYPPSRPLKDWTAPPSLSADHCYVQTVKLSPWSSARRQQRRRANHGAHPVHLLGGRALSACLANGLCAPSPAVQSAASVQFPSTNRERKRVSQIRIRRASPRETLLTPMGLPKVKRLKKKEFSLEEIYTNKNYKSPSANRSLETIFEEPREKDGSLLLIGQQKRRRLLLFPDFTQPRKRKKLQGVGLAVAMAPRKRVAARRHVHCSDDDCDLDVMLVERLSALEDFLSRQGLDT